MSHFLGKISLYDVLAMLIPGGIIYIFFLLSLGYNLTFDEFQIDTALGWFIALVLSYLLGLINQTITSIMWKPFRNNPNMIKYASDISEHRQRPYTSFFVYLCPIIIIALFILGFWHNEIVVLAIVPFFIFCIVCFKLVFSCTLYQEIQDKNEEKLLNGYLEKYYYVMTHTYRNDISIIEGQIAFMQSLLIPMFCILLLPNHNIASLFTSLNADNNIICVVKLLLFFTIIISIPVICERQIKIYQCVFEDFKFLSKIHQK